MSEHGSADLTESTTPGEDPASFHAAAAVTRSMLGWGVVAGPLFFATGVTLALTRAGFDLAEHQLSLLMLGDGGWMQRVNLLLSGLLVAVTALGVWRASPYRTQHATIRPITPILIAGYAVGLLGSGVFPPDPMGGFPPGAVETVTASGILHMVFGLLTFGCAGAAALTFPARWSKVFGAVVIVGFLGGAAFSQIPLGVVLLWLAAVTSYAWLAAASMSLYRRVPHPDGPRSK